MKQLFRIHTGWSVDERQLFQRQLLAVFVVVTLLNLGFYWQRALREAAIRHNLHSVIQGWDGLAWYVWMLAAPATLLLIRRCPFVRDEPVRSVGRLLVGSALIYFVVTNTRYVLRMIPNLWLPDAFDRPVGWAIYAQTQIDRLALDFLTYSGFFAASFAIDYYSQFRLRADEVLQLQLESARLQSELAKSQLAALRGQLHPHFLFNSFNAISALVRQQQNARAVEMIAQLGDLLRFAMEKIELQELPFEQELEFVKGYLNIERVRFGEKLEVAIEVEPVVLDCLVPNLLLQPLVENAIKHGISKRLTPGLVRIAARRHEDRLELEVSDDGPGLASAPEIAAPVSTGIGLRNTKARLDHVYGADYRFEIGPRPEGGTFVRLDLPWREATIRREAGKPVPA